MARDGQRNRGRASARVLSLVLAAAARLAAGQTFLTAGFEGGEHGGWAARDRKGPRSNA